MKDSIGEKQVKVFIMKKFLIVIFTIFGLLIGMFAIMYNSYIKAYEEAHNHSSYSWTKVTYPVEKYSTSSYGNKDDFESSKQEYASSNSSTKYYDYKKYSSSSSSKTSSSSTKYYDYKNSNKSTDAYVKALFLSENSHLSKQKIEQDLTRWYSEDACQYAMNKLNIDWKEQAVLKAKSLQMFHFSKEMLVSQLINVELFTQEEADYAIEQVNFDWKEEAVKKVEAIANPGNMSKEELLELLVKKRKFTQEEAEYAIEHAQVDWLN